MKALWVLCLSILFIPHGVGNDFHKGKNYSSSMCALKSGLNLDPVSYRVCHVGVKNLEHGCEQWK